MRTRITDFIPFYGMVTYFKRFFEIIDKPTLKDRDQAILMQHYHLLVSLIVIGILFKILI